MSLHMFRKLAAAVIDPNPGIDRVHQQILAGKADGDLWRSGGADMFNRLQNHMQLLPGVPGAAATGLAAATRAMPQGYRTNVQAAAGDVADIVKELPQEAVAGAKNTMKPITRLGRELAHPRSRDESWEGLMDAYTAGIAGGTKGFSKKPANNWSTGGHAAQIAGMAHRSLFQPQNALAGLLQSAFAKRK